MPTKLETFLKSHRIKPAHLARESGYSRQHLLRIRMGRMEPTRRCIAAIVSACPPPPPPPGDSAAPVRPPEEGWGGGGVLPTPHQPPRRGAPAPRTPRKKTSM